MRQIKSEFLEKFAPIRDLVCDENAMFSGSKVFAQLMALESIARQIGAESIELAQVLSLMSMVQWKRGELADAIEFASSSLAIQDRTGPLPAPEPFFLHHRIASAAQQAKEYSLAARHFHEAMRLVGAVAELSDSQRLGIRQDLGFALHEAGRFEEALSTNLALLQDAEQLFGPLDERLAGLLNNLAQNQYELKNHAVANAFLHRRLEIAQNAGNAALVHDTLFQLGILAFETGQLDATREWFDRCMQHAIESGDPSLITSAKDRLVELNHMLAGGN